jgi:hypothetical protein
VSVECGETLNSKTCESCRELAPPPVSVREPELVCREWERGQKALPMRASEAALPLREREPRSETRGLDEGGDGERRPTQDRGIRSDGTRDYAS